MSSPHQRVLTLPLVWGKNRESSLLVVETPGTQTPSDEQVMARLQAREVDALNLIFDRYSRLILSIALRVLNDYNEAEEVVQDTFFYVYQKAALFNPDKGTAKAWIVQLAHHRALDRRAHLARRGFYHGTSVDLMDDTLLAKTDMEREVAARLNWQQLQRAFQDLSDMQRRTLELFYFEGLELKEISAQLNESIGNIRHHFYRGLERLRKSAFVQRLRD